MTPPRRPTLQLVRGAAAHPSAPTGSLRAVHATGPFSGMDDTPTELTIHCVDASGEAVHFADAVRAVFDGTADPDDFTTALHVMRSDERRSGRA